MSTPAPVQRKPSGRMRPLVLVGLLVLALAASLFYSANPLIRQAEAYAGRVAVASGSTYVALRTLNGFLSTVQEIEVGGSLVVSGSARPLKVLEPLDDTVERISSVVFAILLIAGVCAVALGPLSAVGAAIVAAGMVLRLIEPRLPIGTGGIAARLTQFGMLLAVALPAAFMLSALAEPMTATLLDEQRAIIQTVTAQVAPEDTALVEDGGIWSWLSGLSDDAGRYRDIIVTVLDNTDTLIAAFLSILAIYLLQLVILPALFFVSILYLMPRPHR